MKKNQEIDSHSNKKDGEELASTSHDRLDGGTVRSNASSTGIILSEANLDTGMIAMDEALDHKGELVAYSEGHILVVPRALKKKALEIVDSPLRSNGNNNDLNYYALGDIDVFVCPWISAAAGGSDTAWHLIRKGDSPLWFLNRERLNSRVDVDDETDARKFKARRRFSYGWTDPVTKSWHSAGDTLAFSS